MKRIKHYDIVGQKGVYALKSEKYKDYMIKFVGHTGPNRKYTVARIMVGNQIKHTTWGRNKLEAFNKAKEYINKMGKKAVQSVSQMILEDLDREDRVAKYGEEAVRKAEEEDKR